MSKKGIFVIALLLLGAIFVSQKDRILTAVFQKGLEVRLAGDAIAELDDGLHVALCGAGGPLPGPNASGPCVAVIAGSTMFVVDAGTDGVRNLGRMGFPAGAIKAVFLTHFHSDHIDGLGEMATIRWVSDANTEPLPVYGPRGVQQVVSGLNSVYAMDMTYRHDHHGDTVAPVRGFGMVAKEFAAPEFGKLEVLYDENNLKIEALRVEHAPVTPAVGYRFTYKGRSVLITGDTIASDNVLKFSQNIDLLVHEALAPNLVMMMNAAAKKAGNKVLEKITFDILDYHASPKQAAQIAKDAGVGHLLYYHIVPPLVVPGQESLFLDGADEIFPDYTVGQDGVMFSMPAGSNDINLVRKGL
ncbi:MAG: ribonuclease Z [Cryomorphaceae bacterium]|jgi:ribonuclease Z